MHNRLLLQESGFLFSEQGSDKSMQIIDDFDRLQYYLWQVVDKIHAWTTLSTIIAISSNVVSIASPGVDISFTKSFAS